MTHSSRIPDFDMEISPVCSLTIMAMESVCSVIPMPERCRSPRLGGILGLELTGSMQRAAFILLSFIIIAPSCRGEFLKNTVSISWVLISHSSFSPVWIMVSRSLYRAIIISAPVREEERCW